MPKIRPGITILIMFLILGTIPAVAYAAPYEVSKKIITENDNGKTIYVKQGNIFYIRLSENPSTGYSWKLNLSKGLSLLETKYYSPKSSIDSQRLIVGAAGYRLWKIKAVTKGNQQLKGIYRRSWEPVTGKEKTFKLNVKVV